MWSKRITHSVDDVNGKGINACVMIYVSSSTGKLIIYNYLKWGKMRKAATSCDIGQGLSIDEMVERKVGKENRIRIRKKRRSST